MKRATKSFLAVALFAAAIPALSLACGGGGETATLSSTAAFSASMAARNAAVPPAAASASVAPTASGPPPPRLEYSEADFSASEQSRDPFRSYAEIFAAPKQSTPVAQQRNVAAERFSLDELKLIALVTGGVAPRAMFVDPQGKGWVVQRGEFLGHAETVRQTGIGGREYELNWRVDRIRDTDVVFVRDDPTKSNAAGSTRVIALRTGDELDPPARR